MKKILFISNSLGLGGSEKAMSVMINKMDLEKYDITILTLNKTENFFSFDPRITIICGWPSFEKYMLPYKKYVTSFFKNGNLCDLFRKTLFTLKYRLNRKATHNSTIFWKCFEKGIDKIDTHYDIVIGYGQNMPTYFLKDKVTADKKIAWLNTDLEKAHYDIKYIKKFYQAANHIVVDSENGKKLIGRIYPEMLKKTTVFPNILDTDSIIKLATESEGILSIETETKILSIGRLVEAKAFHLAVAAADILNKKNIDFKWYIIGDGNLKTSLQSQISDLGLENKVILLGAKTNPYKYLKNCDIYAQTSIYEGSCLTVNEAKIFNKPIVSTNFPAIYEKIEHGKNGLIAEMNAESIAENIQCLIESSELCDKFTQFLKDNPTNYEVQMKLLDDILL